ncbi:MAG: hypothetical protein LBM78_03975 [Clostridiales bacterium]|jgi:hypothetical protein|nr:hypothetical protein [Clostridiales bacterium]
MSTATKKPKKNSQNFLVSYFKNFGLRQVIGLMMIFAVILIGFGLGFAVTGLVLGGLYTYAVAAVFGILYSIYGASVVGKRSPLYRRNLINLVIMALILGLAVAAIVICHVKGIQVEKPL